MIRGPSCNIDPEKTARNRDRVPMAPYEATVEMRRLKGEERHPAHRDAGQFPTLVRDRNGTRPRANIPVRTGQGEPDETEPEQQ